MDVVGQRLCPCVFSEHDLNLNFLISEIHWNIQPGLQEDEIPRRCQRMSSWFHRRQPTPFGKEFFFLYNFLAAKPSCSFLSLLQNGYLTSLRALHSTLDVSPFFQRHEVSYIAKILMRYLSFSFATPPSNCSVL